jgi:2-polyprenyl-3-methyl-5-hydroxy-6-metoxy-1,4-benzoquinol methylase
VDRGLLRPFYHEFAWAYDLIIPAPIQSRCDFWETVSFQRGVLPGSTVLDAGCGAGGYSIELARRGYVVTGLDASVELVEAARTKSKDLALPVTFEVGDILELPSYPLYDGILCRGVLNDLIDDSSRRAAFGAFARALRRDGILVLDVREWYATALRKTNAPVFEKSVETDRGTLAFRSVTRIEPRMHKLLVAERHTLTKADAEVVADCDFEMRCWTQEELHDHLTYTGFGSVAVFGDFDQDASQGSSDRLVAVASLGD